MSQLHEEDDVNDGMTGGGLDCVLCTPGTYNYHGAAATLGSTNYPTVPHILVHPTSVIQMVVTNIIFREGLVKGC